MRSETHNVTLILLKVSAFAIGAACVFGSLALASSGSRVAQTGQERKAIKLDPSIYDAYVGQYELTPAFIPAETHWTRRVFASDNYGRSIEFES